MILLFLAAAAAAEPPTATDPQRAVEMTRLEAANPPTSEELFDLAELYWSEGRDAYGRASAEHQAALDTCARDRERFRVKPAWQDALAAISEGHQCTLGAYHRPWK